MSRHASTRSRLRTAVQFLRRQYDSLRHLRDPRVAALAVAHLLDVMSGSLVVPLLPTYAETLGADAVLLGVVFTLPTAANALLAAPFGSLADRVGRRPFVIGGLALGAASTGALGLADAMPPVLALRALDGVALAMAGPATTAYLGDLAHEENRASVIGAYRTVGMVGLALGPAVGGGLAAAFTFSTPFVALGAVTLAGALALLPLLPPTAAAGRDAGGGGADAAGDDGLLPSRPSREDVEGLLTPSAVALVLSGFVASLGTRALDPLLAPLLAATVEAGPGYVGGVWSAFGLSMALFVPVGGTLADRFRRKPPVVAGKVLWVGAVFGLAAFDVRVLPPLLLAVGGLASAVSGPALSALHYEAAPDGREGTLAGVVATASSLGGVAGPLLGGVVADALGVRAAVVAIAVAWALDAVVVAVGVSGSGRESQSGGGDDPEVGGG
jgi:MFS family permease